MPWFRIQAQGVGDLLRLLAFSERDPILDHESLPIERKDEQQAGRAAGDAGPCVA